LQKVSIVRSVLCRVTGSVQTRPQPSPLSQPVATRTLPYCAVLIVFTPIIHAAIRITTHLSPNSTWLITSRLGTTRHVRRVERVEQCYSNIADDEQAIVLACKV